MVKSHAGDHGQPRPVHYVSGVHPSAQPGLQQAPVGGRLGESQQRDRSRYLKERNLLAVIGLFAFLQQFYQSRFGDSPAAYHNPLVKPHKMR